MSDGTVNWSSLSHAYGPASDVPVLLEAVTSEDATCRGAAIDRLLGELYHQEVVEQAAVPAAAELADIILLHPIDWRAVELLACLTVREDGGYARQAYDTVRPKVGRVLDYLLSAPSAEPGSLALLAVNFPEESLLRVEELEEMLHRARTRKDRAFLAAALLAVCGPRHEYLDLLREGLEGREYLIDEEPVVRSAVLGERVVRPGQLLRRLIGHL